MDKETEIKYLSQLLRRDTYFGQFFRPYGELMISNIRNDFPIETNCAFKPNENSAEVKRCNLVARILKTMNAEVNEAVIAVLREELTRQEVLFVKLSVGIALDKAERQYLTERLMEIRN